MAEVVHQFDARVLLDGRPYIAQVVGRPEGNIWEGWIEFAAEDGSDALRTPRETTQPDRDALIYWASGVSGTYLEGALQRALNPQARRRLPTPMPKPFFEAPAPPPGADLVAPDLVAPERAVLDPFSVGAKGERLLRQELRALRGWHLRNIVRAYGLAAADVDLEAMGEPDLVELIVGAVREAGAARP